MSVAPPLQTVVAIDTPPFAINHDDRLLLLGSCFADNMGSRLQQAGFDVLCNPFGTLYNPLSIATCLLRAAAGDTMHDDDLVCHDGLWHSWLHHGSFSATDREGCLRKCNQSLATTARYFQECSTVVITLGTAHVYELSQQPCRTVANCHRLPADTFCRRRLTIDECTAALASLPLHGKRLIITVSPIRHMADGAHANQLSKATLLLAQQQYLNTIDHLPQRNRPSAAYYFPAYELLLDQLRDYRFYDRDMAHPSPLAVDIIWHHFQETFFDSVTQNSCRHHEKSIRQQQHRPIAQG
ncbi:MAG: GSCFA domain-containing protein [Bacteroidales bacterium]|nr:GSCFA domain-containing protein [Bacteroidales bacterium]